MVKGIIFDFDGVVVDSEPPYVNSVVEYLKLNGISVTFDDVKGVVGQSVNDICAELKQKFNLDKPISQIAEESMDVYNKIVDIKDFKIMDGLQDFLERCKSKGIKMCVASSSDLDYLNIISNNIGVINYFDFIMSGAELKHSKPDPEIYNLAAEKMGIDKKDLMVIEDSVNGIKAGLASGIYTVGIKVSKVVQDTSLADKEVYSFKEIDL